MWTDHVPRCVRCAMNKKQGEGHILLRYGSISEENMRAAPLCKIRELVVKNKTMKQSPFKKSTNRRVRRAA